MGAGVGLCGAPTHQHAACAGALAGARRAAPGRGVALHGRGHGAVQPRRAPVSALGFTLGLLPPPTRFAAAARQCSLRDVPQPGASACTGSVDVRGRGGLRSPSATGGRCSRDVAGCPPSGHARRSGRVVTIDGHEDVPVGDEEALLRAVARQVRRLSLSLSLSPLRAVARGCRGALRIRSCAT